MQLTIELSKAEKARYLERRQSLLNDPAAIVLDFDDQWLRVVGEIGTPAFEGMPRMWLLTSTATADFDIHNLALAHDWGSPWESVPFDHSYWVLDENLADRVLSHCVKSYGIPFLFDFDFDLLAFAFQEVLGYGGWDSILEQCEREDARTTATS